MNLYKGILIASTILITTSAFAEDGDIMGSPEDYQEIEIETEDLRVEVEIEEIAEPYWEVIMMGGTASLDAENTTIDMTADETDQLQQRNDGDWKSWTANLGVGYVIPIFDSVVYSDEVQWLPAVEPQINGYFLKGNINGNVDRYYEFPGNFSDTDYSMELESTRVMFDVSLTLASYRNLSIYAIAGIGPSWNRIDFETPNCAPGEEIEIDPHTTVNFAYEFGGGINYALTEHIALTVEYLYTGFNDLRLDDDGEVGGVDQELKSDDFDLSSQAVLFGIRYAF
jgi:hypothetical protein